MHPKCLCSLVEKRLALEGEATAPWPLVTLGLLPSLEPGVFSLHPLFFSAGTRWEGLPLAGQLQPNLSSILLAICTCL